jgi:hypothetical protein
MIIHGGGADLGAYIPEAGANNRAGDMGVSRRPVRRLAVSG